MPGKRFSSRYIDWLACEAEPSVPCSYCGCSLSLRPRKRLFPGMISSSQSVLGYSMRHEPQRLPKVPNPQYAALCKL